MGDAWAAARWRNGRPRAAIDSAAKPRENAPEHHPVSRICDGQRRDTVVVDSQPLNALNGRVVYKSRSGSSAGGVRKAINSCVIVPSLQNARVRIQTQLSDLLCALLAWPRWRE
eukprot:scaffold2769_cov253-Pinguiococcus_pyrenoidosus.AAC.5